MAQTNNVLVVGGSSGVGLATAKLALSNLPNVKVIISSTSEDKLKKAVEEIKGSVKDRDSAVSYVVGDVSKLVSARHAFQERGQLHRDRSQDSYVFAYLSSLHYRIHSSMTSRRC